MAGVAVPCGRCGRQYDVALFAFGRTIHCCCGARVANEPRVRTIEQGVLPRFFADTMLGRLARWLRMVGLDTAYEQGISDAVLVRNALEQRRVILTRDRRLRDEWHVEPVYLVRSEAVFDQLREVIEAFALRTRLDPFSRCSLCNEPLEAADGQVVSVRAPSWVVDAGCEVRRCRICDRLYWRGSHIDRMRRMLDQLLA